MSQRIFCRYAIAHHSANIGHARPVVHGYQLYPLHIVFLYQPDQYLPSAGVLYKIAHHFRYYNVYFSNPWLTETGADSQRMYFFFENGEIATIVCLECKVYAVNHSSI